jgi:hypothetical protein
MMRAWFSCRDVARILPKVPSCCGSCHDDADEGYSPLLDAGPPARAGRHSSTRLVLETCCAVGSVAAELTRGQWVAMVLLSRAEARATRMNSGREKA